VTWYACATAVHRADEQASRATLLGQGQFVCGAIHRIAWWWDGETLRLGAVVSNLELGSRAGNVTRGRR